MRKEAKLYNLGEVYIKFDFEYNENSKSIIKQAYLKLDGYKSKEYLKSRELLKISIEYEKGSTKTRIVIWGTIINIYLGIGNYGDFKSGVREAINTVKAFSSYVIEHIDDEQTISSENILNTQKRTGILGRLDESYKKIEHLERNINNLSNNEIQLQLTEIKQDIANITDILSIQDRQAFLDSIDNQYKQNLPQPEDRKTNYLYNRYAIKPEDEINIIEE